MSSSLTGWPDSSLSPSSSCNYQLQQVNWQSTPERHAALRERRLLKRRQAYSCEDHPQSSERSEADRLADESSCSSDDPDERYLHNLACSPSPYDSPSDDDEPLGDLAEKQFVRDLWAVKHQAPALPPRRHQEMAPNSPQTQLTSSPNYEPVYAPIHKYRPGLPPKARKRVCQAGSLSAIKELSPVQPVSSCAARLPPLPGNFAAPNKHWKARDRGVLPRVLTAPSSPSPFKSPAKPMPKTNPYFTHTHSTLPRSFAQSSLGPSHSRHNVQTRCASAEQMEGAGRVPSSSYQTQNQSNNSSRPISAAYPDEPDYGTRSYSSLSQKTLPSELKSFGVKGQLYVSIVVQHGLLTVSIDQADQLVSPNGQPCNAYVRLLLKPDDSKRSYCRTQMVIDSDAPVFNESFDIALSSGDEKKRLLVLVFTRDLNTQRSELLGCMSWNVKSLVRKQKPIDGWYYILNSAIGVHKHLATDKTKMLHFYGSVDSGLEGSGNSQPEPPNNKFRRCVPQSAAQSQSQCSNNQSQWSRAQHNSTSDTDDTSLSTRQHRAAASDFSSSTGSSQSQSYGYFAAACRSPVSSASSFRVPFNPNHINQNTASIGVSAGCPAPNSSHPLKLPPSKQGRFSLGRVSGNAMRLIASMQSHHHPDQLPAVVSQPICCALNNQLCLGGTGQHSQSTSHLSSGSFARRAQSFNNASDVLLTSGPVSCACTDSHETLTRKTSAIETSSRQNVTDDDTKRRKIFAVPLPKKLSFLSGNRKRSDNTKLTKSEVAGWSKSFENMVRNKQGVDLFRAFLQGEFSEENIDFWIAVQDFKCADHAQQKIKARQIYDEFVAVQSPKEVNLDSDTRSCTATHLDDPSQDMFDAALAKVEHLMGKDSYPRFLKSDLYLSLQASCKK